VRGSGDEVYSGRAADAGHEVANGAATDGQLSAADPSHVHVGLCRASDVARRPPRPLDARLLRRSSCRRLRRRRRRRPVSAAGAARPAVPGRPGTGHVTGNSPSHRRRRLGGRRRRQITTAVRTLAAATRPLDTRHAVR